MLPYLHYQREFSSTVLIRLPNTTISKGQVHLSCSHASSLHASRARSTVLPRQGAGPTVLSAAAYEGLGQLSSSHILRAGPPVTIIRDSATMLQGTGPTLLSDTSSEGQVQLLSLHDLRDSSSDYYRWRVGNGEEERITHATSLPHGWWGQLSCALTLEADSTVFHPLGSAPLYSP